MSLLIATWAPWQLILLGVGAAYAGMALAAVVAWLLGARVRLA